MRYMVTGGVGFLGTNLCSRLLDEDHEVVAIDDLSTAPGSNLELLSERKNFSFVKHDIVNELPDMGDFDFIYNLACPASPVHYQKDPIHTFRTSVWGLWNVLGYSKERGTPVFQASTSEVYGNPLEHPQNERYFGNVNPNGPRSCYDEGKRAAEALMMDFRRKYSHPIRIARIFNTYGPYMHQDDGRVVSNFITQALNGGPLTIYGDGKQTRSLCYVDDMIDAFIKLEKADYMDPVNLGSEFEVTVNEIADTVESVVGRRLERRRLPLPADDPEKRKPDTELAKRILGWQARTRMKDGLRRTVDHFKR